MANKGVGPLAADEIRIDGQGQNFMGRRRERLNATPDVLAGIPALPVAVAKVLEETSRDEPDPRILARAIESDAGLASKLLSLVNSPYYGLGGNVTSISQAVMVVGMRQVRNVALAVGALRSIPGIPASLMDAFLDRSLVTAKTARTVATKGGLSAQESELAHVGGLLRGVGFLVALRSGNVRPTDREIVMYARMVLERWKLPETIVDAVALSGGPFGPEATAAHAVYVASMIIAGQGAKSDPDAMRALGIAPADFAFFDPLVR